MKRSMHAASTIRARARRRNAGAALLVPVAFLFFACAAGIRAQTNPQPASEMLHLLVGRSVVINSPAPIHRVSIADPEILDVVVLSSTQILVNGKAPGGVSLVLWLGSGESKTYEFSVDFDVSSLDERLQQAFPNDHLHLDASNGMVMLTGSASTSDEADKIYQLVSAVIPKTVNLLKISTVAQSQILLEVKFAEVDRGALSNFGFNLFSLPGVTKTLGTTSTQQFGPIQLGQGGTTGSALQSNLTLTDLLNIFIYRPDINLGATIAALEQRNVLQILAEPNLLTENGKEAEFLSGGEFPVPIVQGGAVGSAPTVTVMFKQFGVSLKFTPELTDDGTIHLKVRPEVSALDYTNAVTISGFLIPAISTRRADVQVALQDGQSFAIAGLEDDRVTNINSKVPVLGSIPLFGELFKSDSKNKTKTELLVLVTPHIVNPISKGAPLPSLQFPVPFTAPQVSHTEPTPGQK
ncbi:MAG: pilus assembly protein N-terminal domain-containing protein [Candidatus Acidiferrales bacterium]